MSTPLSANGKHEPRPSRWSTTKANDNHPEHEPIPSVNRETRRPEEFLFFRSRSLPVKPEAIELEKTRLTIAYCIHKILSRPT